MNLKWKIFTAILVVLVAVVAVLKFVPIRGKEANMFMGVDGDPRMKLCTSPTEGAYAKPELLKALEISGPLSLSDKDKAIYRIMVLRPIDQKSISITFNTPNTKTAGHVKVGVFEKNAAKFEESDLKYEQAASLVNSFEDAKIWGKPKPTLLAKEIAIPAEAIIEIAAPKLNKCVITRYDDERIRELMADFDYRIPSVLKNISMDGFAPPGEKMFGKKDAPKKDNAH